MNSTGKEPERSPMKLLPHQTALLDTVFNAASKRVILLRGDVGLGKTTALVAVSSRLLQERPAARALFLGPSALVVQYVEKLRDANVPSLLVDRYRFREMLDTTAEGEIWPSGVVAVMSFDFAKQDDVRDGLARTHWDLVIADEWHQIKGARAEALRQIGASAERVVLASATLPDLELSDPFPAEEATVVEWRRDRVVDHDGKPLDALPRPLLHKVPFSLSPAELSLSETVGGLCRIIDAGTPQQRWIAKSLLHSLHSSPAALEGALQRLVGRLEAQESMEPLLESSEEELLENQSRGLMDRPTAEEAAGIAARALQEIEVIGSDSKLGAFGGLLSHLGEVKAAPIRICVLTEYLGTLYYLAADIEGHGMKCQLLHGGMGADDRRSSLTQFLSSGGILLATRAVTKGGVNLSEVTDLVLYDLPNSHAGMRGVLGQFELGRRSQLNVHALVPSNRADALISESLGLLHDILGSPAGEGTRT